MSRPHTLDDALRNADTAVYNWLRSLLVDYDAYPMADAGGGETGTRKNTPVFVVMSSPERAFAALADQLVAKGMVDGAGDGEKRLNAKRMATSLLPLVSFERINTDADPEFFKGPVQIRNLICNDRGLFESYRWPDHWRTSYDITWWSKKRYTDNYIEEWLTSQFGQPGAGQRELFLTVHHPSPIGPLKQALRFDSLSKLDDLEGDGQRYVRTQIGVSLRTWVFTPPEPNPELDGETGTPAIQSVDVTVEEINPKSCDLNVGTPLEGKVAQTSGNQYVHRAGDAYATTGQATTRYVDIQEGLRRLEALEVGLVSDQTNDRVTFSCVPSCVPSDGLWLIEVFFRYRANGPVDLQVLTRDPDNGNAEAIVWQESLSVGACTTSCLQRFLLIDKPVHCLRLVATHCSRHKVVVWDIDHRNVYNQVERRHNPLGLLKRPGDRWGYEFRGLQRSPYLFVFQGAVPSGCAFDVTLRNDLHPDDTDARVREYDPSYPGLVLSTTPNAGRAVIEVPRTATVTTLYAVQYTGPYRPACLPGDEIDDSDAIAGGVFQTHALGGTVG